MCNKNDLYIKDKEMKNECSENVEHGFKYIQQGDFLLV